MNENRKIAKIETTPQPKKSKQGYRTKIPKRPVSEIHIARARFRLGCKNCVYANFCAAQPTLRAYVDGVYHKDMSELKNNPNYREAESDIPLNVQNEKE